MLRNLRLVVLALAVAPAVPCVAQDYPLHTVTIIGSSGAGALTDVLARAVGDRLSKKWNQAVIIEAKPGASYALAAMAVARAAPDGYTLIASELGMFTYQHLLYKPGERPYDGQKDFVPVSGMAEIPVAVVANPSLGAKTMDDLVKLAKANPGGLNYGTAGPGTFPHLSVLMLEHLAGIKLQAVHYRGAAPALNDVVAGHINLIVMGPSVAIPSLESGAVRFLGVGSEKPMPQLKDVKPIADTVPGYAAYAGFGVAAPAKTPMTIVEKINADIQEILADPEFRAKALDPQLLTPITGNPAQFAAKLKVESENWQRIIADSKLLLSRP